MDHSSLIESVNKAIAEDRLEQAVIGCVRLAKALEDYLNAAIFLREMYDIPAHFRSALRASFPALEPERLEDIIKGSAASYLDERTIRYSLGTDDKGQPLNVVTLNIGEMDSEITQLQDSIASLTLPPGLSPFDAAALSESRESINASFRLRINALRCVRSRVKARCLQYTLGAESLQEPKSTTIRVAVVPEPQPEVFLHRVQADVNAYFQTRSEDVHSKLEMISKLALSSESEDGSLLLTAIRRCIKSVADFFLPASAAESLGGAEHTLGDEKYLNRLHEYIHREFGKGSSEDLLKSELNLLANFVQRLNKVACKGVHATVHSEEAKQGAAGLYLFLYNVTTKLQLNDRQAA